MPHAIENNFFEENARLRTFSGVFSWKRLNMAICKFHIPILEFPKERVETIFGSIGEAVQDLANFSFIFSQIWIAYISRIKTYIKNPSWQFCTINPRTTMGGVILTQPSIILFVTKILCNGNFFNFSVAAPFSIFLQT